MRQECVHILSLKPPALGPLLYLSLVNNDGVQGFTA